MLDDEDCDLILGSLYYVTKREFEKYPYPSDKLRREQLARCDKAIAAVRSLRKGLKFVPLPTGSRRG